MVLQGLGLHALLTTGSAGTSVGPIHTIEVWARALIDHVSHMAAASTSDVATAWTSCLSILESQVVEGTSVSHKARSISG